MNLDLTSFLIGIVATPIVVLILRLFFGKSRRVGIGDIVLFVDPQSTDGRRNMLTKVLDVFPKYGTAIIRCEGTTTVVSCADLQVLHADPAFPILIPSKPETEALFFPKELSEKPLPKKRIFEGEPIPVGAHIGSRENCAKFSPIPHSWFNYSVEELNGKMVTV